VGVDEIGSINRTPATRPVVSGCRTEADGRRSASGRSNLARDLVVSIRRIVEGAGVIRGSQSVNLRIHVAEAVGLGALVENRQDAGENWRSERSSSRHVGNSLGIQKALGATRRVGIGTRSAKEITIMIGRGVQR